MAITKEIIVDKFEVVGDFKHIQVREVTVIKEDGVEISRSNHRKVLECGSLDNDKNFVDTDISSEDASVKATADAIWTQAIKDAYKVQLVKEESGG